MEFAPKGLKVGDVFELDGKKFRVTQAFDFGYNTEEVIPMNEIPFAPDEEEEEEPLPFPLEEEPKKTRRKTTSRTAKK